MDRLEAMATLVAVIDEGGFSAAGRRLGLPVSTVSRRVGELETLIGTRLLNRTTRKVTPSDAGATYLAAARKILAEVEEAEQEAAGEYQVPKGELVLTAPILLGRRYVLPLVADFLAIYPEINVRLVLSDRNVHLVEDHVDMAVRIGALTDSAMIATRIGALRTVVAASPALLAARGTPADPAALADLPCVAFDTPMPAAGWRFPAGEKGTLEVAIRPRLSVTTAEAAVAAAVAGVGATRLLHYQVADAVAEGALHLLLEHHEFPPAPVHLLHAARGQMPLKMRRFIDFAAPALRDALARLPANPYG